MRGMMPMAKCPALALLMPRYESAGGVPAPLSHFNAAQQCINMYVVMKDVAANPMPRRFLCN
jgi:hypothetical protein